MTRAQSTPWVGRCRRLLAVLAATALLAACEDGRGFKLFQEAEYPEKQAPRAELLRPAAELDEAERERRREAAAEPEELAAEPAPAPETIPGSGVFIAPSAAERRQLRVLPRGDITFNFVDADVREVVRAILGDTLELNYVVDPDVQGAVTVQTSRPLPRRALVGALENILRLVGAALVQGEDMYRIVPVAEAAERLPAPSVGVSRGARIEGFGVRIVPLQHVAAAEMAKILEPVAPEGAVLRADAARNLLMLSGTRRELESMMELVELFDVDWLAGTSFALYPLENATAKEVVAELGAIFGEEGESPLAGLVRLVAIERINTVLVISPRQVYLEEAGNWIKRLDRGGEGAGQKLYVYYVQNGRATDLAEILREIFALPQARAAEPVRLAPGLEPVEIESAPAEGAEGEQGEAAGRTQAAAPRRAAAAQGQAQAQARARSGRAEVTTPLVTSDVRIIADESNNALVVMATPAEYRQIEAALRKLDIVPLQVLIEATIAEVSLTDELRYGIQWFFKDIDGVDLVLSQVDTGAIASVFPGFSALYRSVGDPRAVLNALEGVTDVNVISSPQLLVLDNQTALLQVGDEVPVPVQQAQDVAEETTLDTTVVTTVEFRDTGVILRVTPRVNAGGLVTMEIEQEVSDVVETVSSGIDAPTIQQRLIQSTVAIQSGETVALGGLIRDSKGVTKSGLPFLQDIPVLGALFRDTANTSDRTELLVLITPRVIHNVQEAREVTHELRRRLRTLAPLEQKIE